MARRPLPGAIPRARAAGRAQDEGQPGCAETVSSGQIEPARLLGLAGA
jgi:hypothetical protein